MSVLNLLCRTGVAAVIAFAVPSAYPATITVILQNLAPQNGTFLTPPWVGFHNGGFNIYNLGAPASAALERLAEDGTTADLAAAFLASGTGTVEGTLASAPVAPGQTTFRVFNLDPVLASSRFFSYAAMVIPSNDAFIANGNPMAVRIFDDAGNFIGADFILAGATVLDAGTEVNDEIPANTAFFGQATPNTGVTQNGVVALHPGFLPPSAGGILADPAFANADFLTPGYQIARITIIEGEIPEPSTWALLGSGFTAFLALRRRRR